MKVLKYILFVIVIAAIGSAIYIAVQPNTAEITKTQTIHAPVSVIYNYIQETKDTSFLPSWANNHSEYENNVQNQIIEQKLYIDGFNETTLKWLLKPGADGKTETTLNLNTENIPFKTKALSLFKGRFEDRFSADATQSLKTLDSLVTESMKVYSVKVQGLTNHGGGYYIYKTTSCKMNDLSTKMQESLLLLTNYAQNNNLPMAGAPFVNYIKWDEANNAVIFSCCIPTTTQVITTDDSILTGQLEPFKAVRTTLKGDYSNLKEAWDKTFEYIEKNNLQLTVTGPMLEVYLTDPNSVVNPANWITELYVAIQE